jgi:hypothetical protein
MISTQNIKKRLNHIEKYSISVLLIVSIISIGSTLLEKIHIPKQFDQHIISLYNKRLEGVKPFLKKGAIVGYLTDDVFNHTVSKTEHAFRYMVTRYCLAPIFVADSINYKIVIGDFHGPVPFNDLINMNLKINKNLGQGLLILKNVKYDAN